MSSLVRFVGTKKLRWKMLYAIHAIFNLLGKSWNDFYGWMLNFQDRQVTLDHILSRPTATHKYKGLWDWGRGNYYVEFMKDHGLKPTDRVLDLGCGYGRVAIPILRYQTGQGYYIGTEISIRRLELAREWVSREGLAAKPHEFILSKENSLPYIADDSIDVAWVMSVFNHMPDSEFHESLAAIARILRPGGKLFAYFTAGARNECDSIKDFRRTEREMRQALEHAGFAVEKLEDFNTDLQLKNPDFIMYAAVLRTR